MRTLHRTTLNCGDAPPMQPPFEIVAEPSRSPAVPRRIAARSATRPPALSGGSMERVPSHGGPIRGRLCRMFSGLWKVNYCYPDGAGAGDVPSIAEIVK